MSDLPCYSAYQQARTDLIKDGWRTPNTYCNMFEPITEIPAVYLFLMVDEADFSRSFVAYVGMSQNLKQRMTGHPILSEIRDLGHWVMTWFKPTPFSELRRTEAEYIKEFDPPWNIAGRTRGVSVQ